MICIFGYKSSHVYYFQKKNQVLENSVKHTNKFGGKHDRWKNVSFEVSISLNIV